MTPENSQSAPEPRDESRLEDIPAMPDAPTIEEESAVKGGFQEADPRVFSATDPNRAVQPLRSPSLGPSVP